MSGSPRVETTAGAPSDWDAYVERHPQASAYHRAAAVEIGARAFGLRTAFLAARDERSRLIGALPLVEQSSALFGRFLVSLPFVTYGGILAEDPPAAAALAAEAAALGRERRADHVELRHTAPLAAPGFAERLDKVSMILALPDSEAELLARLGSKLRSQIRRAEREPIEILWGGAESLRDFYPLFAAAMHGLGTPVYSRRFFEIAYDALREVASVLVVRLRGEAHAAAILVRHGRRFEVPWAAASPRAKRLSVNMRMYSEMLRFAVAGGAEAFDFGRSTVDSGTYRFKAQWGAQAQQLHWHYWLRGAGAVPKLNQSNPKYARAAALWRRMPLCCANLLGPYIARKLP
ncbi:MAG TPA: FemAB family XrtA/PEP-CTERM system-associated protein [Steroidobacteraceae bacterium]|nr:FemAB family XrtA/PEP-CTERM system-associated protein [Steroidobacteraceae bacterium]